MKIVISNRSGVAIYEQIREQIKAAIMTGDLRTDEALPSIRGLARDLRVSVITTTRAYADLEAEGYITTMPGKGCFVLPRNEELARENALSQIETALGQAISVAKQNSIGKNDIITRIELLWEDSDE
ncbi:MAG: GntR family transcriptional regulator [Propionibacteriaceae bacterium]|jgi:GntR family transcriptional regulator|nr:GntR family transcriptional regulator [Propionibacteriaceae bacterium]